MIKINVKPLSVNKAWKGKRYKTDAYKIYERVVLGLLPKNYEIPESPYELHLEFGFSSDASDWDNPIKNFQDILAKKYKFNDKLIKKGVVTTEKVLKGKEYVKFEIKTLTKN